MRKKELLQRTVDLQREIDLLKEEATMLRDERLTELAAVARVAKQDAQVKKLLAEEAKIAYQQAAREASEAQNRFVHAVVEVYLDD